MSDHDDAVAEGVLLLKTIGLDITYTDEGLEVIVRQIMRLGRAEALTDAADAIAGMRGLTLDGPRMQVHAEKRISALLLSRSPHTMEHDPTNGPPYCKACTDAAGYWVKWPCPDSSGKEG